MNTRRNVYEKFFYQPSFRNRCLVSQNVFILPFCVYFFADIKLAKQRIIMRYFSIDITMFYN